MRKNNEYIIRIKDVGQNNIQLIAELGSNERTGLIDIELQEDIIL